MRAWTCTSLKTSPCNSVWHSVVMRGLRGAAVGPALPGFGERVRLGGRRGSSSRRGGEQRLPEEPHVLGEGAVAGKRADHRGASCSDGDKIVIVAEERRLGEGTNSKCSHRNSIQSCKKVRVELLIIRRSSNRGRQECLLGQGAEGGRGSGPRAMVLVPARVRVEQRARGDHPTSQSTSNKATDRLAQVAATAEGAASKDAPDEGARRASESSTSSVPTGAS